MVAEATVALKVVEFHRNRGLHKIILEGNSLQMVNALNAVGPNCSIYRQIVADVQAILHTFWSWQVCHTKRGENFAAHGLAKEGVKHCMDRIWVDCIPEGIRELVLSEAHTLVI